MQIIQGIYFMQELQIVRVIHEMQVMLIANRRGMRIIKMEI